MRLIEAGESITSRNRPPSFCSISLPHAPCSEPAVPLRRNRRIEPRKCRSAQSGVGPRRTGRVSVSGRAPPAPYSPPHVRSGQQCVSFGHTRPGAQMAQRRHAVRGPGFPSEGGNIPHIAVIPPSANSRAPVTWEASSEAQNSDRGGDLLGPARALQNGALCSLGLVLLDRLAGSCDAALMERREDRAGADGVHTNALPMYATFHRIAKRASTIGRIHLAGTALLPGPRVSDRHRLRKLQVRVLDRVGCAAHRATAYRHTR